MTDIHTDIHIDIRTDEGDSKGPSTDGGETKNQTNTNTKGLKVVWQSFGHSAQSTYYDGNNFGLYLVDASDLRGKRSISGAFLFFF